MTDDDCVSFLQWALPRLERRWPGYRKVRKRVCKRIRRRARELGLAGLDAYRERLEAEPREWEVLDDSCHVTISRFRRDHEVWGALCREVLPALAADAAAAGERELRCWSIGCASGEEPYTLTIVWALGVAGRPPGLDLRVLATDVEEDVLRRARAAEYDEGSLRELPEEWRRRAFERRDGVLRLREPFRRAVELRREDVRDALPDEAFRLVLCRNLVLTYFAEPLQLRTLERVAGRMSDGAALVVGGKERLPPDAPFAPWRPRLGIHRRTRSRAGR